MKICIFSIVTYWHGLKGGMDLHGKHLLEGLSKGGHKIIVISTKHPSGKEYEEINDIKIHYLKHTTFGSSRKGWKKQSINKFKDIMKTETIDIMLSQSTAGYSAVKIAKRMRIPFVTIMHGCHIMVFWSILNHVINLKKDYLYLFKSFLSSLYYTIFQEFPILKNSSAIIAVSNEVAQVIKKWHFVDKKKIYTVYNGVEVKLFCPDQKQKERIRKSLAIPDKEKVLLFFSFVTKQKGLHLLIKALPSILKENNYVKLLVAGEGNYLADARQTVRKLGLDSYVVFTGHIPHEEASNYINASDVFILPTLRQEGMPFSLLEAMACQKPVITSKIGGIPSVIDDGINGLLIPPGEVSKLIEKTVFLLNNKDFADKLADNARKKVVQNFSHEKMIEDTIKVFKIERIRKQEQK